MIPRCLAVTVAVIALLTLGACQKKEPEPPLQKKSEADDAAKKAAAAPAPQPNPERNAYFGETHVHTSWSLDAFAIGNLITTPADAYKYFKGEPIKHPLGYDDQDRHAARLGGRHRPLRVRRRGPARERAGVAGQQAARRAAADPQGESQGRDDSGVVALRASTSWCADRRSRR